MTGSDVPLPRPAARVLLCDSSGRILMFKAQLESRQFWITPGGGLNNGESFEAALAPELWEETGLRLSASNLCCVWTRSHVFEFRGRLIDQQERYYLLRLHDAVEVTNEHMEAEELTGLVEHRWWSAEEIESSSDVFAPRNLGRLLRELLRDGAPDQPIDVGI